ncbi:MAG: enolase [Candidatus Staskawiczbacteria bacterium]|nr:enolase [Candidatus Staskawiczbacteria bacterium]
MSKIKSIVAREIEDSRGKPTVEVELETERGVFVASCPSGASTGAGEALELRDADGLGVSGAINNINKIIAPKLKGKDVLNQQEIDRTMLDLDGTENKSTLGANAILPVSMAVARAGAAFKKVPLYKHLADLSGNKNMLFIPLPMFNILNGGRHVHKEPHLDIQEFMIVPSKKTIAENLVLCNKVFNNLKGEIEKEFGSDHLDLGDEGGFAPPISSVERALFLLKGAVGVEKDVNFALDSAASEFYENGKYIIEKNQLTRSQMIEFYKNLASEVSLPDGRQAIISFEDPFAETDWEGFKEFTAEMEGKIIIGDDLTTTNVKKIKEAHSKQAINGVLIKLNQIGTVTETIEAINMTKSFNWKVAVSHRSGETMDNFIADLAVGTGADFLKAGSPAKPERMIKYQRLLEIENEFKK